MSDDIASYNATYASIALFAIIALLIGWDIVADYRENAHWGHIAIEFFVLLVAAGGTGLLWRQLHTTRSDLIDARGEAEQWRKETQDLIQGLGAAIQKQFILWQLTRAEAEVGLFLLKGLSHREIAQLRQTSERTIREQARSVYRKGGLSGRAALSAFFLEELLLPHSEETRGSP